MTGHALVVHDAQTASQLRELGWRVSMWEPSGPPGAAVDLILCPLRPQGGCGARLLGQLKGRHPGARVLLVSDTLRAGDSDYLTREAPGAPMIRLPADLSVLAIGIAAS